MVWPLLLLLGEFSSIDRINKVNVSRLIPVWTHRSGDVSDGKTWPVRSAYEATPVFRDGVLYVTTPFGRLIAIDGDSGRELWAFDPKIDRERAANLLINRGASFWTDGKMRRLFYGTLEGKLHSIDAATGKADDSFGSGGFVNLRTGAADRFPDKGYGLTSPPAIFRDLVICGSLVPDGEPRGPSGVIRAFDARSGRLRWAFHTVPRPGEFGFETWAAGSAEDRGGVNAWSLMSVDAERGMVFVPLTSPSYDYYGGDRKGANLFGDSVVALDAATGKRIWHFQTVHHNIWDYDLPSAPNLVEVKRGGKLVPAVAQITKTGFVFVLDRMTGKPLFDVVETPVAKSDVPGEDPWPTQPMPVKPPPFARQSFSRDELTAVSKESRDFCAKLLEGAVAAPLFTPIGLKPTVLFPGTNGGSNWGGGAYDPATRTLFVNSMDVGMLLRLEKRPEGSAIGYRTRGSGTPNSRFWDPKLQPCQQPPWGHLTAIRLDTGDFAWREVLGAPLGAPNLGGALVTKGGVLFIAATNDKKFRAFDKETGKLLWETTLPASGHATPMTYRGRNGKQYVVIAAGGGNKYNDDFSDSLVAFSLPD